MGVQDLVDFYIVWFSKPADLVRWCLRRPPVCAHVYADEDDRLALVAVACRG